ncbi:hypothetical protein GC174_05825 [bacterium]|nr:hypothetical protein [bacterium]
MGIASSWLFRSPIAGVGCAWGCGGGGGAAGRSEAAGAAGACEPPGVGMASSWDFQSSSAPFAWAAICG